MTSTSRYSGIFNAARSLGTGTHSVAAMNSLRRMDHDEAGTSLKPEDIILPNLATILKEYKSLECSICAHDVGLQHKYDPNLILCSVGCLAVAINEAKTQITNYARSGRWSPQSQSSSYSASVENMVENERTAPNSCFHGINTALNSENDGDFYSKYLSCNVRGLGREGKIKACSSGRSSNRGNHHGGYLGGRNKFENEKPASKRFLSQDLDLKVKRNGPDMDGSVLKGVKNPPFNKENKIDQGVKNRAQSKGSVGVEQQQISSKGVLKAAFEKHFQKEKELKLEIANERKDNNANKSSHLLNVQNSCGTKFKQLIGKTDKTVSHKFEECAAKQQHCETNSTTKVGASGSCTSNRKLPLNPFKDEPFSIQTKTETASVQASIGVPSALPSELQSKTINTPPSKVYMESWKTSVPSYFRTKEIVLNRKQFMEPSSWTLPVSPKVWTSKDLVLSKSFKTGAECIISFMWKPEQLTLITVADEPQLYKLQEAIAEYTKNTDPLTRVPSVGDILFALYNGSFYRGQVERVSSKKQHVLIRFLDYGDESIVKFSDCREPCHKLMKIHPTYGADFSLSVSLPAETRLNNEIRDLIDDSTFTMHIENESESNNWKGTLRTNKNQTLNALLVELYTNKEASGQAQSVQIQPDTVSNIERTVTVLRTNANLDSSTKFTEATIIENTNRTESTTRDLAKQLKLKPNQKTVSKARNLVKQLKLKPKQKSTIYNMSTSENLKGGSIVRINYMWNYGKLSISAEVDNPKLCALDQLIESFVEKAQPLKMIPELGDIVIAPYGNSYFRAKVVEVDGQEIRVEFVDYGDESRVIYSKLYELNSEIRRHPIYGVVINMLNVPPNLVEDIDCSELDIALENPGQVEIVKEDPESGQWHGHLWMAQDRSWSAIYLDALEKKKTETETR